MKCTEAVKIFFKSSRGMARNHRRTFNRTVTDWSVTAQGKTNILFEQLDFFRKLDVFR